MPPEFVRLAANEVRWRLLVELARSDLRVRELTDLVGEPQNLVSYHLGKLRSAGMVTTKRSSADGRDIYYQLDLGRCAELLAGTGAALHPALTTPASTRAPTGTNPMRVLFLCTGNSARSPMAAALLRHRAGKQVDAQSAGSHPKPLHPDAVRAMAEYEIDLSTHRPKQVNSLTGKRFEYIISLCDRVREVYPAFSGRPVTIHWSTPDPSAEGGYRAFRRTAAELDTRIRFLIPALDTP